MVEFCPLAKRAKAKRVESVELATAPAILELNRVSFNGAPAKYDIRTWSPDHTKMGKGITLSNEEFQVLVDAFKN